MLLLRLWLRTLLKELQIEIRGQAAHIKKLIELLELQDSELRAHTIQVQNETQIFVPTCANTVATSVNW